MHRAKKSLSQNFIVDKNICKKIINLTKINKREVLEIGPGYGFLTDIILINKPKKLILVEKDDELALFLRNKYKENKNVEVINNDVLNFNFNKFQNLTIISNLPYNIGTKIILNLFRYHKNICEMVFMIQKEVAIKFDYNLPKMNKYKFVTKIIANYSRCFDVSSKVFIPKPKVKSTVVKFIINKNAFNLDKAILFSNLIFRNIRKKISKNVSIKNKDYYLLNKRVNELSLKELLDIYNFF